MSQPRSATLALTVAGPDGGRVEVELRRSVRRRRTVSAYLDGTRVVVLVPARLSRADERHWAQVMVTRLVARQGRRQISDEQLLARAEELAARYLEGRSHPTSVRWVGNQGRRWGSCTIDDGSIRISERLRATPAWVVDYVLLHELAHLLEPGHGPAFWSLLDGYPRLERARGYLEGLAAASDPASGPDAAPVP